MPELKPLPVPNPKRQLQGLNNRAEGKAFEKLLEKTFDYYALAGYARIDKTPEPMKVLRKLDKGRFIACFEKKAQPDYKGIIKGGRTVIFEAKFTSKDRIAQDAVNDDQAEYLNGAAALGARCYVLAGFKSGTVYRIPWDAWADMKKIFGHKYVTEAELKPYQVGTAWNDRLLILD